MDAYIVARYIQSATAIVNTGLVTNGFHEDYVVINIAARYSTATRCTSSSWNGVVSARKPDRSAEEFLPLSEVTFQVLLALIDRERHGYGIMHEVEIRTAGRVRLGAGTLYGALKRLVGDGLVEEAGERSESSDDERRRYYRMSPLGRAVARAEARRLASAVRLARDLRLISPEVA